MITVYFATNRNPLGDPPSGFGRRLGPIDGTSIRFGMAEVDEKRLQMTSLTVAAEKLVVRAEATEQPVFGSAEVYARVRRKMLAHARDTLVYIHGFDYAFEEAVVRAAEVKLFLGIQANLFLFTWPSDGIKVPLISFASDRSDVEASGDAMARALVTLDRFLKGMAPEDYCSQRVHLMAHSMGNYALRHAVQGLRRRLGDHLPRLFDKVFLMGADEDNDAFELVDKLKYLPRLAQDITVYHTPKDRALTISEVTKRNPERLGSNGPESTAGLSDKISVVDVTDVLGADDDDTNHQYYRLNDVVRADLRAVLADTPAFEIPGRKYFPDTRRYRLIGQAKAPRRRSRSAPRQP